MEHGGTIHQAIGQVSWMKEESLNLVDDFVAVITSMANHIYGRLGVTLKSELKKIKQCVGYVMQLGGDNRSDD
jgi:predicted site-specific integrase-resolvase